MTEILPLEELEQYEALRDIGKVLLAEYNAQMKYWAGPLGWRGKYR